MLRKILKNVDNKRKFFFFFTDLDSVREKLSDVELCITLALSQHNILHNEFNIKFKIAHSRVSLQVLVSESFSRTINTRVSALCERSLKNGPVVQNCLILCSLCMNYIYYCTLTKINHADALIRTEPRIFLHVPT